MKDGIKNNVVNIFGVNEPEFHSWLNSLRYIRNICAHHNRLWNIQLSIKPRIPGTQVISEPAIIRGDRLFGFLSIISYMYKRIGLGREWIIELENLFLEYKILKIKKMGFPNNWKKYGVLN
jgi:abortive infection bacteriophage resistance protein